MQQIVKNFNDNKTAHKKPMPVYARILDIQSELGELAKEYLKHSRYGTVDFDLQNEYKMEYGDVLYSLLSLANEINIDCEECLNMALKKYQERLNKNNSMASGK